MSIRIDAPHVPVLFYSNELPPQYDGPLVPNSSTKSIDSDSVQIVVQQLQFPGFTIRYSRGQGVKKWQVFSWQTGPGLCSSFMLKNGMRKTITALGKAHLRPDYHQVAYIHRADCSITMEQEGPFELLEVVYSADLLHQVGDYFPQLANFLGSDQNRLLGRGRYWTPPQVRELCLQILRCPYDKAMQQLYLDMKVRELLFFILQHSLSQQAHDFTGHEVARLHEARQLLENSLTQKTPTIRELSRRVGLNEFKLKKGFRLLFHTSIFDWALQHKMLHAKTLLESTRTPMKEIARITGYQKVNNFMAAYKKYFGITPGAVRRS